MYAQKWLEWMRRFRTALAVWMLVMLSVVMATLPVPAQAQGLPLVTCAGAGSVFWSPAVTNQSAQVTTSYVINVPTCVNISELSVGYATGGGQVTSSLSCTEIFPVFPQQALMLHWSGGGVSTVTFIPEYLSADGVLGFEALGEVTAGLYQGSTAYVELTAADVNGLLQNQCASSGLASANAQVLIEILPL